MIRVVVVPECGRAGDLMRFSATVVASGNFITVLFAGGRRFYVIRKRMSERGAVLFAYVFRPAVIVSISGFRTVFAASRVVVVNIVGENVV